jgi:hypothetical protein
MYRSLTIATVVLFLFVSGCGSRHPTAAPVDEASARATLQSVLESWQRGESAESWRSHEPEVVVQDFQWSSGAKLKEFEILGPGEARDANLYCRVRLILDGSSQGKEQRTVTYVVGTDPALTVFRDSFN